MEHISKIEKEKNSYIQEIKKQMDDILNEIEESKNRMEKNEILKFQKYFKTKFENVKEEHKKFNSNLVKLGKSLDSSFHPMDEELKEFKTLDSKILNELIGEHFYREGYSKIGEIFEMESKIKIDEKYKKSFEEMYKVLECIMNNDLYYGLQWCQRNQLKSLEFKFHQLIFIEFLKKKEIKSAIQYARNNFNEFKGNHWSEIQYLMGSLTYKNLESSPYSSLLEDIHFHSLVDSFKKECCSFIGKSFENPFYITITVGSHSLPILLKLLSFTKENVFQSNQMSTELFLDDEFIFHSIFTCPISKELSSNPCTLLPCCHVLSKKSVDKLLKGSK
jgi:E3 ubiquitin-protein transferase RMND5